MPEVSELVESINIMSGDIEKHIVKVQEHANTIDQQYISMINLLVETVEMNDSYTYHHSVSVAKYTMGKIDPSGKMKDRLRFEGYRSGHMMYLRAEDLATSNEHIRDFIKKSLPAPGQPAKY